MDILQFNQRMGGWGLVRVQLIWSYGYGLDTEKPQRATLVQTACVHSRPLLTNTFCHTLSLWKHLDVRNWASGSGKMQMKAVQYWEEISPCDLNRCKYNFYSVVEHLSSTPTAPRSQAQRPKVKVENIKQTKIYLVYNSKHQLQFVKWKYYSHFELELSPHC